MDPAGTDLGHLAVLDSRPMPKEPRLISLFQIFANRAAAEHQRLRAEAATREHERPKPLIKVNCAALPSA